MLIPEPFDELLQIGITYCPLALINPLKRNFDMIRDLLGHGTPIFVVLFLAFLLLSDGEQLHKRHRLIIMRGRIELTAAFSLYGRTVGHDELPQAKDGQKLIG